MWDCIDSLTAGAFGNMTILAAVLGRRRAFWRLGGPGESAPPRKVSMPEGSTRGSRTAGVSPHDPKSKKAAGETNFYQLGAYF